MPPPPANNTPETAKPIRVGLVAGRATLRNLGAVVRHLIVGLLDEPMAVSLICPVSADAEPLPELLVQTIRYPLAYLPFFRSRALEGAAAQLRAAKVSVLHALDADALTATRRLAAKLDVHYLAGFFSLRWQGKIADERCQGLLAASEPIRQVLVDSHAGSPEMVHLLRPGLHQVRNATCFVDPTHAVAIVAAGEMKTPAPFAAVLEAFAQLRQAQRECVFFLIGNGPAEKSLRGLAEKLGLWGELTLVDRTAPEELTGILKGADIFISPAPSARLDIGLLAAMAGGVPVLAADGGAADFVIPDRTALTFPPGNAAELTVKLKALLDDRASARALAQNALAHLREHHSPAKMARQLVEIYRSTLARARAEV